MARKPSNPLIDDQIMDQAFSELAALVEESEALLGGGRGRRYRQGVRRQLDQAVQRASTLASQLAEGSAPALRSTEGYVRDNPFKAVGMAAAVGVLAALVINRR
jgi:ElaB/YqjD/DUF883 family membrane-anchored ribosome-binding protein